MGSVFYLIPYVFLLLTMSYGSPDPPVSVCCVLTGIPSPRLAFMLNT